jgi:hypothetical protein
MTPLTSIDAATFERMNILSVLEKNMLWESVKLLEDEMLSVSFHRCRSGEKSPKFRYKNWGVVYGKCWTIFILFMAFIKTIPVA